MNFSAIDSFVSRHRLLENQPSVVLGLSGGPDSLFLLHYLVYLRSNGQIKRLIAAHLDHQWRTESASEVLFCKEACDALNVEFVSGRLSELSFSQEKLSSKEEIGRKARRVFLESILKKENADFIALAHHLQDQEETFFIRLVRASSLTGLIGIRPKRGVYIRPLLETSKMNIVRYLNEHAIPYLTDPTNAHCDYLRNRIRATILPACKAVDERFDQNFLVTLNRLRETEDFLENLTAQTFALISHNTNDKCTLDVTALLALHPVMQYRVLMQWLIHSQVPFTPTQLFLNEIIRFLGTAGSKEHELHKSWKLVKKKGFVHIQMQSDRI